MESRSTLVITAAAVIEVERLPHRVLDVTAITHRY
jgi:hypothetical protein